MRLHADTVDQVSQRVDIVDVVSEHVVLRKSGTTLRGACPFHKGSNASAFSVDPRRQMYRCFNCQAAGGAIKFLMDMRQQSFGEVVLELAQKYGVPVKTVTPEQDREFQRQLGLRDRLLAVLARAAAFYHHALWTPQGAKALAYLTAKRGLSLETIRAFQMGYAPPGWDTLHGYLVRQKGEPVDLLETAGLVVARAGGAGHYDRFRDRVMVPIADGQGRVVGFGGRTLGDDEPKYLNSPESPVFAKGHILFALDKARNGMATQDRVVVVEGYFDAIALHQAGITEAVATMGIALGETQIRQLARYTPSKRVILNFDADRAGTEAAERAIAGFAQAAYDGTIHLQVLSLPAGKDADEFLKEQSPQAFRDLLAGAPLFLDWQIERRFAGKNLERGDVFQEVSAACVALLQNLPDNPLRSRYVHQCAQRLSRGRATLAQQLEKDFHRQLRRSRWLDAPAVAAETPTSILQRAEAQLLQIYLHHPEHRRRVGEALAAADLGFNLSHHRQLWQWILNAQTEGRTSLDREEPPAVLLRHLQLTCAQEPALATQLQPLLWLDDHDRVALLRPHIVVEKAIARIQLVLAEKRYRYWRDLWAKLDLKAEADLGRRYSEQIQAEKAHIAQLQRQIEIPFGDLTHPPADLNSS